MSVPVSSILLPMADIYLRLTLKQLLIHLEIRTQKLHIDFGYKSSIRRCMATRTRRRSQTNQIHWIAIMALGNYALSSAVDYYGTPNLAWLRKHLPTCEIEHDFLRTAPNGIDPHFAVNALDLRPG